MYKVGNKVGILVLHIDDVKDTSITLATTITVVIAVDSRWYFEFRQERWQKIWQRMLDNNISSTTDTALFSKIGLVNLPPFAAPSLPLAAIRHFILP